MTSARDVETWVTTNSPSKDSFQPYDQIQSRYVTPEFKQFSVSLFFTLSLTSPSWLQITSLSPAQYFVLLGYFFCVSCIVFNFNCLWIAQIMRRFPTLLALISQSIWIVIIFSWEMTDSSSSRKPLLVPWMSQDSLLLRRFDAVNDIPNYPWFVIDASLLLICFSKVVELCIDYGVRIRQPRVSDNIVYFLCFKCIFWPLYESARLQPNFRNSLLVLFYRNIFFYCRDTTK